MKVLDLRSVRSLDAQNARILSTIGRDRAGSRPKGYWGGEGRFSKENGLFWGKQTAGSTADRLGAAEDCSRTTQSRHLGVWEYGSEKSRSGRPPENYQKQPQNHKYPLATTLWRNDAVHPRRPLTLTLSPKTGRGENFPHKLCTKRCGGISRQEANA